FLLIIVQISEILYLITGVIVSSIEKLGEMVDGGDIEIVNMVSVPRSISTALGRALQEGPQASIFVNEPFHSGARQAETALAGLVEVVDQELEKTHTTPLTVIAKSMSSYISDYCFCVLEDLSKGTIWTVRDPKIQMGSLLTRLANDIAVGRGEAKIEQEGLSPYLDDVVEYLIRGPRLKGF